ncbi:MAG: DNA primase [Verrucomicrobia bacterium]|nr:MAG: DNA primase [Verrucomicrobiota bacterium]PYK35034.1 MAG: DNA primase [Verrucomicrobiota bacterium]PYL21514.1 MAG: DNA primase [Verrucomicrobiota bacterium]PYL79532.1 MAG: DNA primase [Verrucomicrobiota bacterium]
MPVAIPSETIEQIAAANDIVEVIGSYFPLRRAGANFKALCPFHQEKTPSFLVSPSRQTFHCFGCGAGGSVFRFVMDYEHVDFPSAVRKLAARVRITVVEKRGAVDEDRQHEARRTLLKLHAEAAEWFHENLIKREVGEPARKYLKQRGITAEIAKRWQLGYAPDEWEAFGSWARERGYDVRGLIASGLVKTKDENDSPHPQTLNLKSQKSYDRFRGRIIFPICNDVGEVIAFSGRLLKDEEGAAKYLNSPETPLFRKASVLFGLDKSKRALIETNCAIVCEGQLDLISLFEAGITNVVAPQGTAFTENQARILKRYVDEVVLCFDSDAAGTKAAERSLEALLQNDLIVRVAEMPAGEDPDSLVRREGKEEFEKRIGAARDFFDYWIDHEIAAVDLHSLGAKVQVARRLAEIISRVHDPLLRGEAINKASARLAVPAVDFETLLPKQSRWAETPRESPPAEASSPGPRHEIAMLCLLALRDEAARNFLQVQNWREVLEQVPDAEILIRILESDLHPDDAASLNAFMATLAAAEERLVSSWLLQRVPAAAGAMVEEWWLGIRHRVLRRQLDVAKERIKVAKLSTGDIVNLQKQILDLQDQLHELCRPASMDGS